MTETPKAWNQCDQPDCDRYVPCRRHPHAGIVGPVPPEEFEDLDVPIWWRSREVLVEENHRLRALYADLRRLTAVWVEEDAGHGACSYAQRVAKIPRFTTPGRCPRCQVSRSSTVVQRNVFRS